MRCIVGIAHHHGPVTVAKAVCSAGVVGPSTRTVEVIFFHRHRELRQVLHQPAVPHKVLRNRLVWLLSVHRIQ